MKWRTVFLVALSTLVAACSQSNPPPPIVAGWQVGYSDGVTLSQTSGIWSFTFPQYPGHVNMVTQAGRGADRGRRSLRCSRRRSLIRSGSGQFDAGNTCNPGSLPQIHFYFQRAGDDFSGAGDKQYYRWWSKGYDIESSQLTR